MPANASPTPRAAAALAVLTAALVLASCGRGSTATTTVAGAAGAATGTSQSGFDGAALPGDGTPATGFALTDENGERVSLGSYRGRVVVLTFLYPGCGATCVLIAQQIRGALDELHEQHARAPAVLIVSADPRADSPARARALLAQASLSGRALYLTGSETQLRPLWHAYGVQPASAGAARFARVASVFVIDASGRERVLFEQQQLTPEALAHDIGRVDGDPIGP